MPLLLLESCLLLSSGCASHPPAASPDSPVASHPGPSSAQILRQAAAKPTLPLEGTGWEKLGSTNSLAGWRETDFAGRGEVRLDHGLMVLNMGDPFTGVNWTGPFPTNNYEVAFEAMRVIGSDFFCGLTVPVRSSFCSLIVGGWGGSLIGISSLDGLDASENETTKYMNFENGRWYLIRLRVTSSKLEAWIDQDQVIDVDTTGKSISLRPGDIELSKPFGLASWETTAAFRNFRMRILRD